MNTDAIATGIVREMLEQAHALEQWYVDFAPQVPVDVGIRATNLKNIKALEAILS